MKFKKIAVIICRSILEKKKENECGNQITYFWRTCLKSIFQNVNVLAATMAILTIFVKVLVMKSIFQNVNVLAATMVILKILINVLVMKNMSEINFSKCKCPVG